MDLKDHIYPDDPQLDFHQDETQELPKPQKRQHDENVPMIYRPYYGFNPYA